ncbi:MAG: GNAT family N-acetyltransferase [Halobacteriovoraceae bacterium]|jgi:RimJ/RimL family protein N-acetyltransferase|nr:GNAT family N-acetyltransferase [Halobacteriovoraceae bacterium]
MKKLNPKEIKSLAIRTNMIMDLKTAQVEDKGEYVVIRTPSRPSYFWGNYILMREAPFQGCYEKWLGIFEREIGDSGQLGFASLAWDIPNETGEVAEFLKHGFKMEDSRVLTCSRESLVEPPKFNSEVEVRPLVSDADWKRLVEIHFEKNWEYGSDEAQLKFLQEGAVEFRKLCEAGEAVRMGAYFDGLGAADLGLYWQDGLGRFNNVATHEDFRRRGICGRLVYETCKYGFEKMGLDTLVMEADENYHAAKIYESVGFSLTEKLYTLGWYDKSKFE